MNYNCPLCNTVLVEMVGNKMHPGDVKFGVTLDCKNTACPAQEVMGHGDNAKEAWGVVQAKFVVRTERTV